MPNVYKMIFGHLVQLRVKNHFKNVIFVLDASKYFRSAN